MKIIISNIITVSNVYKHGMNGLPYTGIIKIDVVTVSASMTKAASDRTNRIAPYILYREDQSIKSSLHLQQLKPEKMLT